MTVVKNIVRGVLLPIQHSVLAQLGSKLNVSEFAIFTDSEDGTPEAITTDSEDGTKELILIDTEDR